MNTVLEDPKLWRAAVISGVVSVGLLAAAIVPIGMLLAPVSLVASLTGFAYGIRSLLKKEEGRHIAVLGMLLSLIGPSAAVYLFLFHHVA